MALSAASSSLLLGVALFALVLSHASALHCWVCSSDADSHCADPFNTTARHYLVLDCDRDRAHSTYLRSPAVCRKYIHKVHDSGERIVVRSCAWGTADDTDGPCSSSALHFVQHLESCSICNTDECNSATGLQAMSLLFALPLALIVAKMF